MGVRGQYEHLASAQATEEDVLEYLAERSGYVTSQGGAATPIAVYWAQGDLERYRAVVAAWATDAPPRFALPDLPTMLNGVAGPADMPHGTFIGDLTALWTRYAAWMQGQGRDPLHANETADQRRTRKARESMARTRARRTAEGGGQAHLDGAKQAYDAYMDRCRERAEARKALDAAVSDAWQAYLRAKAAADAVVNAAG